MAVDITSSQGSRRVAVVVGCQHSRYVPFFFCVCFDGRRGGDIVPLAGAGIGINAALISIVTEWLSDMKMGYCSDGWWLNQEFCCWELEVDDDGACDAWHLWSTVTVARWFIYVLFAVSRHFPTTATC